MANEFKACVVDGCNGNSVREARGRSSYCSHHYNKLRRYGDPHRVWVVNKPVEWLKENATTDARACLDWPFTIDSSTGYGQISINRRNSRAHRFMCELVKGPPPTRKHQAAHSCGNRACVNPRHLSWKTQRENEADKLIHGTANRGERASAAKLTAADVIEIRMATGITQNALAEQYGVSRAHIAGLRAGKFWPELQSQHP